MANLLIDYTFNQKKCSNPDGTFEVRGDGVTITKGPGQTPAGKFRHAWDLGLTGKAAVTLTGIAANYRRFCIRIVFQVNAPITTRQVLIDFGVMIIFKG
jgi:hypothetical protein